MKKKLLIVGLLLFLMFNSIAKCKLSGATAQNDFFKSANTMKQFLDSTIRETWDKTANEWGYSYKTKEIFAYSESGIVSGYESLDWNRYSNEWINFKNQKFDYEIQGNTETFIIFDWIKNSEEWRPYSKEEYTNDENNLLNQITSYWDKTKSVWIKSGMIEYGYNTSYKVINAIDYDWDESNFQWVKDGKEEYIYDENSNCVEVLYFNWDNSNQIWEESSYREENSYDENNILQTHLACYGNTYKTEFYYNESVSFSETVFPQHEKNPLSNSFNFKYMLTQNITSIWKDKTGIWEPQTKVTYYYSEHNFTIIKEIGISVDVFPNPVTDFININIWQNNKANLKIFDMQGRLLSTMKISGNTLIDLGWLECGIYLYSITSNNIFKEGKFIKQ
jgi:hypothetical protein